MLPDDARINAYNKRAANTKLHVSKKWNIGSIMEASVIAISIVISLQLNYPVCNNEGNAPVPIVMFRNKLLSNMEPRGNWLSVKLSNLPASVYRTVKLLDMV